MDGKSSDVRRIINELCSAETDEQAEDAAARLTATLEAEHAAAEEQDRERRRRTSVPRLLPKGTAERAVDEMNAWIEAARATAEPEVESDP